MKKLYFKFGVMGSSKSAQVLMTAFNYKQKGVNVLLLKHSMDNRDLKNQKPVIASRIGLSSECELFNSETDLFNLVQQFPQSQVVIVDEAQFCSAKQIEQLKEVTLNEIPVLCYGLKTNFKGELFEGSKRLLELAESIQEIKSICRCGGKATMNARIVDGFVATKGKEIQIGGDEIYESMCFACFKKYQTQKLTK